MKVIAVLRKSNSHVYIRVRDGRGKDIKVSTSMYIDPIYWDSKIPGYKNTNKVPKEVREKFNNTLKEMIAYVEANVDKDVTCPVLTAIIDDFLHPDRKSKENTEAEDTTPWGSGFFDRAEQYLTEYKTKNASGIRAVFRRLERLEAWKREMEGDTDFRYEVSTFGAEQLEEYMKYVTEEYDLYVKHPDFFAKFGLYHSTMRPSSKNSSFSGGLRLKAFLNWCVKKGYSDDVSFRQVQTHGHVYGDAYYLTIEERNQVYQCQYGRSYHAALVKDMFVFQCLVGCRMGDLFSLTRNNIIDGWLEYIPGKNLNKGNTELVRVPLCDTAKEILARYSHVSPRLFPVICEAQYNMYIKFVLDFAGIHRMVTVLNPLTRQPEQKMLCDVATSHTARKTFIGDLYAKVKDQALVSSLTGHSPQSRAFQRYRTIDDTMKRELIGMLEE